MKRTLLFITLLSLFRGPALIAQNYEQQRVQLQFFNHYGTVPQRSGLSSEILGSEFLDPEWRPMDVKLQGKDTLLHFDAVRINLVNANLEVLFQGQEKVIAGHHFEYVLPDPATRNIFVPANIFHYEGKPLSGFMEVIGAGPVKVLVQHYAYVREPNAQAHVVGGYTVNRLLREKENFLYDGTRLVMIKRKKDLQAYFYRKNSALRAYLKENNPNIRDPYDLLALAEQVSTPAK